MSAPRTRLIVGFLALLLVFSGQAVPATAAPPSMPAFVYLNSDGALRNTRVRALVRGEN